MKRPYREAGAVLIDGVQVTSTLQCVHCNAHWDVQPGSGIVRGFCLKCMGPVCGPKCVECRPFEKWLEEVEEAGRKLRELRGM